MDPVTFAVWFCLAKIPEETHVEHLHSYDERATVIVGHYYEGPERDDVKNVALKKCWEAHSSEARACQAMCFETRETAVEVER